MPRKTPSKSDSSIRRTHKVNYEAAAVGDLAHVAKFNIKQKFRFREHLTYDTIEDLTQYEIQDDTNRALFLAEEQSNFCDRCCLGATRPFKMWVKNRTGAQVLCFVRQCGWSCMCGFEKMFVLAPPNQLLGKVTQTCSIFRKARYVVHCGGEKYIISGIKRRCCGSVEEFTVTLANGNHMVAKISKRTGGFNEEMFHVEDFTVTFRKDISVKLKAILLGASLMIDFLHFKSRKNFVISHL